MVRCNIGRLKQLSAEVRNFFPAENRITYQEARVRSYVRASQAQDVPVTQEVSWRSDATAYIKTIAKLEQSGMQFPQGSFGMNVRHSLSYQKILQRLIQEYKKGHFGVYTEVVNELSFQIYDLYQQAGVNMNAEELDNMVGDILTHRDIPVSLMAYLSIRSR